MNKVVRKTIFCLLLGGLATGTMAHANARAASAPSFYSGFYAGLGGSWNTTDMHVSNSSTFTDNANNVYTGSGDAYVTNANRYAPMIRLGYWAPYEGMWMYGVQFDYKYLNNLGNISSTGVGYPSNSFQASNLDSVARVNLEHQINLMGYFGMKFDKGYLHVGFGPSMFLFKHTLMVTGATTTATPNTAANLNYKGNYNSFGIAAQFGCNHYVKPDLFVSMDYTYAVSSKKKTKNNITFAGLGTGNTNGTYASTKKYSFTVQDVMFSLNKVFTA